MNVTRDIPHDPDLPQLATVLDGGRMRRVFQTRYDAQRPAGDRWSANGCEVEWVKYKPGKNCTVCYRLTLVERDSEQRRLRRLVGRAYPRGGAASRLRKARRQTPAAVRVDGFLSVWPIKALEMVVWSFPHERKLRGLATLTDVDTLRRQVVPGLARVRWGERWSVAAIDVELMHYAPEQSAAVRVSAALSYRDSGERRVWVIFGKAYPDEQGRSTLRAMQGLWDSPPRRAGQLSVPRPLCYQPEPRVVWQEGLPGQTLRDAVPDGEYPPPLLERLTAAIVALQQTRLAQTDRLDIAELQRRLQTRCVTLAAAAPAGRATLHRVVERLQTQAAGLDRSTAATLHGDLHPQNLLLSDRAVALIDLDGLCQGPPLQDIGSWLASLFYRGRLQGQSVAQVQQQMAAFVAAYRRRAPWPVPSKELAWYTAVALISERAFLCLSRFKAGRLALSEELIRCADRLSRGEGLMA